MIIQYYAPVQDPTGLGQSARDIEKVLKETGHDIYRQQIEIHPGGGGKKLCHKYTNFGISPTGNNKTDNPDVTIIFAPPHMLRDKANKLWNKKSLLIGYTMWETSSLLPEVVESLEIFDGIFTPTKQDATMFDHLMKRKIGRSVGLPVDTGITPTYRDKREGAPVKFCSCFEWSDRKGGMELITAFILAFQRHEASLTIKSRNISRKNIEELAGEVRALSKSGNTPEIKLVNHEMSTTEMDLFYRDHDCFALLTRGEGWCYPAIDAFTRGLTVVMTEYCGVATYIYECEMFKPVKCSIEPVLGMTGFKYMDARQNWRVPSIGHAVTQLREAAEARTDLTSIQEHRDYIVDFFDRAYSLKACAERMNEAIDAVIARKSAELKIS